MDTKTYKVVNGTHYDSRTPDDLITLLESIRATRKRVRLIIGDTTTGKVWESATPDRGRIGRSTGPQHIPLLVRTSRSLGGEGILDYCILQVRESVGGRPIWTHPSYKEAT